MMRELRGRRLLITGASSGIGRAVAEQAARAGACLVLAARSADKLDALARELTTHGAEVIAVVADVTSAADRSRLLATAVERFDGLDALINNAGVGSFGHFAEGTEAILRQVMEVNFFAPAELIRLVIPVLERGNRPAIVNVASMCGRRALPAWSEYSASSLPLPCVGHLKCCGRLRTTTERLDKPHPGERPGIPGKRAPAARQREKGKAQIKRRLSPQPVGEGAVKELAQRQATK